MPLEDGELKKEVTILDLSKNFGELLTELQIRLDERFDRQGKCTKDIAEPPSHSNVLDQIISNLKEDRKHLQRIIVFILSDVLPKIN